MTDKEALEKIKKRVLSIPDAVTDDMSPEQAAYLKGQHYLAARIIFILNRLEQ